MELSEAEKKMMEYINDFYMEHYFSPTDDEIVEAGVIHSSSHVRYLADSLIQKGFLLPRPDRTARTFIPVWVKSVIDAHAEMRAKFLILLRRRINHPQNRAGA